jgi:GntR family transcriptional regulator
MSALQIGVENIAIKPVDPQSPMPLYHQVEQDLRRLIRVQELPVGSLIPPEIALSEAYGVGRQTMRMAISHLVDDGLVKRQAGRGTFVQSQRDRRQFYLDRSFTQQMIEIGLVPRSSVIESTRGIIDHQSPVGLSSYLGEPYFQMTRVRYGSDHPIGWQQSTIREKLCPGIEAVDFSRNSLYEVISKTFNHFIREIHHTVNAFSADEKVAKYLKVKPGTPLLQVNSSTFIEDGQIVEFSKSLYRSDRYEFSTRDAFTDCQ